MRIDISVKGIEELERSLKPSVYQKASRRTVRRMGQRFKTAASKEVRKQYTVPAKRLKSAIQTKYDSAKNQYRFYVSGKSINLIHFGARSLKRGGVSVRAIKKGGGRIKLRHAFIAPDSGGHLRVFSRKGKGAPRLPIKAHATLSVPQMFNKDVIAVGMEAVKDNYDKEFIHNLEFYASRAK